MSEPTPNPEQPLRRLTIEAIEAFMKTAWGATEVAVLGNIDGSPWIYYRGGHATRVEAKARHHDVEVSLGRFIRGHTGHNERPYDEDVIGALRWQDHRAPLRWPFQKDTRPYRTGEICHVGDTIYSRDGSNTYSVIVNQGEGQHRLNLREMPGFAIIEKAHQTAGIPASFSDRSRFDPKREAAAELLRQQAGDEYWDDVADFLIAWHERVDARERMIDLLRAAGFSDAQIQDVGLNNRPVDVEPI